MDLTIPISGAALGTGLMIFVGKQIYASIKKKFERFEDHIETCADKAVQHARLEVQVQNLDEKVDELNRQIGHIDSKLDTLLMK